MTKYLVTGGAGFIGSNIAGELLNQGKEVRVLDNFSTGRKENIQSFFDFENFEFIEGDLRDFEKVQKAVDGVEYVLHQGALPSVPRSIADPVTSNEVNINGTLNMLKASRDAGVKRLVFASSSSVYGNNPVLPKVESMSVQPLSPYALTKYAGERYCQLFTQLYHFETVCLRYFNVFGPKQDPASQYSAVIPKFINLITKGVQPIIYGDGLQSRDFTFVKNNVKANLLACHAQNVEGEVFNIACGARFTLNDLLDSLNKIMDKSINPVYNEERPGDVKHSLADISKAEGKLGYKPYVDFNKGLEETVNFFVK